MLKCLAQSQSLLSIQVLGACCDDWNLHGKMDITTLAFTTTMSSG